MEEGKLSGSLDRIEAALSCIETAARSRTAAVPVDDDLARRHETLKVSVAHTLSRIDTLIGGQEP